MKLKTLLIALMACFFATGAMANQTFDLGETFTVDMQDSCKLNDKKEVECTPPDDDKPVASISFSGVVFERANLTQVRLKELANDKKGKEKTVAAMKKRVLEWMTRSDGKLGEGWDEPIGDIVQFGKFWVTYGAVATHDGMFLMKAQIWYDGSAYELNAVLVDSKQNLNAFMDAMKTLRLKGQ